MAHYFGWIYERVGSLQFDIPVVFHTDRDPDEAIDYLANTWRIQDAPYDDDEDGYWHGEVLSSVGPYRAIPKEDFEVLAKYLVSHYYHP
jgi:hypothetical protein